MFGIKIRNPIHWRSSWSADIGRRLAVQDSSYDLFVFAPEVGKEEILAVLAEVPDELYELITVSPTGKEQCEIWTDQEQCYRLGH